MTHLLFGGRSSLAQHLIPLLMTHSNVLTAGRMDCDIKADLTTPLDFSLFPRKLDAITLTAASFGGNELSHMVNAVEVNVAGTLKVCDLARVTNCSLLTIISTSFVSLAQNSPFYSIYALSKKHCEEVAQWYCQKYNIPLLIIRPSQIYGAGDSFKKHQPFFFSILDKVANTEDVTLYGHHDPKRNYIHVEDVASAINRAVKQKLTGLYACVAPASTSYGQVTKTAIKVFNSSSKLIFLKNKPNIPDNECEIETELYEALNWFPAISLEDGIRRIAQSRSLKGITLDETNPCFWC